MEIQKRFLLTVVLLLATGSGMFPSGVAGGETPVMKSGFVTTPDGARIHYLESGPGSGKTPPLLFIPGWTIPAEIWEPQLVLFARSHRVMAMDPRSQGESSQETEGHYPAARGRDIKAVIDQKRLAPVVLVGWSMGVAELAAYVDQFGTDSIAGFVLVEGVAGFDVTPEMTKGWFTFLLGFQQERKKATEQFVRGMFKKPPTEDYLQRIIRGSLRTPTNTTVTLGIGLLMSDHRPALAQIDKPTLIVVAASPFMPHYQDMQRRIPGARMEVFEDTGHALFVDEPRRFNSILAEFIASLSQSGPSAR